MADQLIEILLFGLGPIGSFYALLLHRNPNARLTVCCRSNYAAVRRNGVSIVSDSIGTHHFTPAAVIRHPSEVQGQKFDFIVCCNKAIKQDAAAGSFEQARIVDEKTTFVLMQNGVGNEDAFHETFPRAMILSGVVWVGADVHETSTSEKWVARQFASDETTLGVFDFAGLDEERAEKNLQAFVGLMENGGGKILVEKQIQKARWEKVISNAAWNSLTTLTGCDTEFWLESSDVAMETTRRLMKECIDVAKLARCPGLSMR